jgi:hypothetical protein
MMCVQSQNFYRLDVQCEPCPNLAWLLIVAFVLVVTVLLILGVWLNRRRINLAALGIGVDFAQVRTLLVIVVVVVVVIVIAIDAAVATAVAASCERGVVNRTCPWYLRRSLRCSCP